MSTKTKSIIYILILILIVTLIGGFFWLNGRRNAQPERQIPVTVKTGDSDEIRNQEKNGVDEFVVYQKEASWGPCMSDEPDACKESIKIYNTGKAVINNNESNIGIDKVSLIQNAINETGIGDKECNYEPVLDYWATYYIYTKKITFPGCEGDLRKIDKVIDGILINLNLKKN